MAETVKTKNHEYVVGKFTAGQEMRLARVMGAEISRNELYMAGARLCASIESIDGVPCLKLSTPEQYEKMADQIGEDFVEVSSAFKRLNGEGEAEAEGLETAKN